MEVLDGDRVAILHRIRCNSDRGQILRNLRACGKKTATVYDAQWTLRNRAQAARDAFMARVLRVRQYGEMRDIDIAVSADGVGQGMVTVRWSLMRWLIQDEKTGRIRLWD